MPKPGGSGRFSISSKTTDKDKDMLLKPSKFKADTRAFMGERYMQDAILDIKGGVKGFIARNTNGEPIGAVSYRYTRSRGNVIVEFLGSDQSKKGIGTALMVKVAKNAAKNNAGLILRADPDSVPFYQKLGFTVRSDNSYSMSLSAKGTKALASRK